MRGHDFDDARHEQDRCTVLLKAALDGRDVLAAHATFDYYVAAWQRLIKEVALPVLALGGAGAGTRVGRARQCFSGSAGQVASLDDFYLVRGEVRFCFCLGGRSDLYVDGSMTD